MKKTHLNLTWFGKLQLRAITALYNTFGEDPNKSKYYGEVKDIKRKKRGR